AARLVAGIDPARLSHLGLARTAEPARDARGWGGPPASLHVDVASPYLVEVARGVAAALSAPGHEIRPDPLPYPELTELADGGRFSLMVDLVRRPGPTPRHAVLSLVGAASRALADNPPRAARDDVAVLERTLSLAVLGDFEFVGARAPDIRGL